MRRSSVSPRRGSAPGRPPRIVRTVTGVRRHRRPLERVDHRPQYAKRLRVPLAGERRKRPDHQRNLIQRRLELLDVTRHPTHRDARMPARVFPRHQRGQLERFGKADPAELACHAFGNDEIAGLERSSEDGARTALLRGRRSSSRGRSGCSESHAPAARARGRFRRSGRAKVGLWKAAHRAIP